MLAAILSMPKLFLGKISSDLKMAGGDASDSEGIDILGIDEYIRDHINGETAGSSTGLG